MEIHFSVIGAGKMGTGIAAFLAMNGCDVKLWALDDSENELAHNKILDIQTLLVRENLPSVNDNTFKRITITTDLTEAVSGSAVVIECIIEDLLTKQNLFRQLECLCSEDVILCSNTSSLRITDIASACAHPQRVIGTHFFNPAYLIPLVEIIMGEKTSYECCTALSSYLKNIGKKTIIVSQDIPGFVVNRLQNALVREALALVSDGIVTSQEIDDAVKYSFGLRLGICGPLAYVDSIGVDLSHTICTEIYPTLNNSDKPLPAMEDFINSGRLGFKTSGHGFSDWSSEEMIAFNENMITNLIKIEKILGII